MHSNALSTVVLICNSPSWHSELPQSMPSSPHLLSFCTNARLGPPFLPKSTTLTQQPLKFVNGLLSTLTPSNHRLINTANLLHPCMLVSQLACMMPFATFGSPLQWYTSYPRTATRYAPAMVLFTATWDDTCMNALSGPLTLFQMPQQPHHRLLSDPTSPCHSLDQPHLHNQCSLCLLHPQHLWLQRQTTAVPTMPAVLGVPHASMPVTPSVVPVEPRRSGHAHVAPKCLIRKYDCTTAHERRPLTQIAPDFVT